VSDPVGRYFRHSRPCLPDFGEANPTQLYELVNLMFDKSTPAGNFLLTLAKQGVKPFEAGPSIKRGEQKTAEAIKTASRKQAGSKLSRSTR
jgi:hypothetical protein